MQEIEVCFNGYVLPITAHIDFTFAPGRPATPPSYASGGDPPEGASVEIDRIRMKHAGGWILWKTCEWLEEFVDKSLRDDPSFLIEHASNDRIADEDEAAERRYEAMHNDNLWRL